MAKPYNCKQRNEADICPIFLTLGLLTSRWTIPILFNLQQNNGKSIRFKELQRALGQITQSELTKKLRELERSGLITRTVFAQVPPRVEYKLTKLGASLREPIGALEAWAEKNGETVKNTRLTFDAVPPRTTKKTAGAYTPAV